MKNLIFALILILSTVHAQEALFGRVYDQRTGSPLSEVEILLPSGKKISDNRSDGRFELAIPSRNGTLLFKRKGFVIDTLVLSQVNDLYNVEIYLKSDVERLATNESTTQSVVVKKGTTFKTLSSENLQLYTGMNLDLAEQVRLLPGVSATQEFKDQSSFLGSAPGENISRLGPFALKQTRHLDIGIPGNNSVLSPSWISSYKTHSTVNAQRPLVNAGGEIEMELKPIKADAFKTNLRAGTVLREVEIETPFWGDGLRAGFRVLDGSIIQNLGDKYFAEFRKRSDDDTCIDPCKSSEFGNKYDLGSWDLFLQSGYSDSTGQLNLVYHSLKDDYSVKLDTARSYSIIGNKRVEIFAGSQENQLMGFDYNANEGWGLYSNYQIGKEKNIQRDSAGLWSSQNTSEIYREDASLLENIQSQHTSFEGGAYYPLYQTPTNRLEFGLGTLIEKEENTYRLASNFNKGALYTSEVSGVLSFHSGKDLNLNVGYKNEFESGNGLVVAGAKASTYISEDRLYSDISFNGDLVWENKSSKGYESRYQTNSMLQLGYEITNNKILINTFTYGRYYPEASLPRPDVFASFQMKKSSAEAWITGAGMQIQYATHYQHGIALSMSTQYGEYQGANSLAFAANRLLDLVASYRWYPRNDSLLSVIVTHRATLGEPSYDYKVDLKNQEVALNKAAKDLETHRTDLRLQLNLDSKWPPLEALQFYLELNNLFATFDSKAVSWLGGDNARQRGWTAESKGVFEEGDRELTPYLAPGMGFFLQFGVEGRFGF